MPNEEIQPFRSCTHCGAKLEGRWESLTKGICKTLIKFWSEVVAGNANLVHLQKDLDLSNCEYNNFQKLRYFGLVAKVEQSPGCWLITRKGAEFVHGRARVHKKVKVFRNLIQERSAETVGVMEIMACDTSYWPRKEWFVERAPDFEQMGLFE